MFSISIENGYFQHKVNYDVKSDFGYKHSHNSYELHYIIKGEGTINIEGSSTDVQGCNLIVLPPYTYHYFKVRENGAYERIILNFPKELFPNIDFDNFFDKAKVLNLACHHEIIDVFEKMVMFEKFKENEKDFERLITLFTEEILLLLKNTKFDNGISKSVNELTSKILCYINDHIDQQLTIDDIASALYISKSHLQNTFIKSMKTGVKNYIIIKKMNKAHMLLKEGKRATDVAFSLGYTTYSCFYKSYVKVFGEIPRNTK